MPARIVGAVSFYDRKEVKDVIAYLRLLGNGAADSAFERIVNVPARGLGDTTVQRLREAGRMAGWSLLEAAKAAARGEIAGLGAAPRRKLQAFVQLLDGLRDVIAAQGASVAETIIPVVDRSGLRAKLEADDSAESRDRLENLAELVTTASDFDDESDQPRSIDDFLERIALSSAADDSASEDQVTLMTIHVAKGLEWQVVFLAGMEDGLFPSLREREGTSEDAALEEERRLAYVAITRARERLLMTHARTRRVWGEIRMQGPSRFLSDLPASCLAQPKAKVIVPAGPRIVDGNFAPRRRSGGGAGAGAGAGAVGGGGAGFGGRYGRGRAVDEFDQRGPDEDVARLAFRSAVATAASWAMAWSRVRW